MTNPPNPVVHTEVIRTSRNHRFTITKFADTTIMVSIGAPGMELNAHANHHDLECLSAAITRVLDPNNCKGEYNEDRSNQTD